MKASTRAFDRSPACSLCSGSSDRAATASVSASVGEVGHEGLAQISGAAAVRGRHRLIDVVCADGAVVTVPVK